MNLPSLRSDLVELGLNEEGGQLWPVRFKFGNDWLEPMHKAHWDGEPLPEDMPPMLRNLRGDFFCAPFGANDLEPSETRPHGATANAKWNLTSSSETRLELELSEPVLGARVSKRVHIQPGEPVVYQEHRFEGGMGRLPLGHHAMLRADEPLLLGFSEWDWGGTPSEPIESDSTRGRSSLMYPQEFNSLERARVANGIFVDLTTYPSLERSEELLMLVAKPEFEFAWSAATNQAAGWVWFALKDPKVLRGTVLWMSNGGRDYPPFSSRHTNVIGIEEVTSNFHLGHRASNQPNWLNALGIPTTLELQAAKTLEVRYVFGTIPTTPEFGRVSSIRRVSDGIELEDESGNCIRTKVDLNFIVQGDET